MIYKHNNKELTERQQKIAAIEIALSFNYNPVEFGSYDIAVNEIYKNPGGLFNQEYSEKLDKVKF